MDEKLWIQLGARSNDEDIDRLGSAQLRRDDRGSPCITGPHNDDVTFIQSGLWVYCVTFDRKMHNIAEVEIAVPNIRAPKGDYPSLCVPLRWRHHYPHSGVNQPPQGDCHGVPWFEVSFHNQAFSVPEGGQE